MAAVPPPVGPPPVGPVFSLTPAALHTAAFIDLGSAEGRKLFSSATKPLDEPYDGSKSGLHMFIHQVATRALICGWTNTILTIPKPTPANPNATLSLMTQYGQIDLADIEAHAITYQADQVKAAQDANMMKIFLDGSLNKTLMLRVLAKKTNYSGPAMLRVILQLVGLETAASVAVINAILRTLPAKMTELKSDIVAFNEFVTDQCNELTARGQQPYDILHLLFEAYRTTANDEFQEYIRSKQNSVYDGSLHLDYHDLMSVAEEKFKIMKTRGEWITPKGNTRSNEEHIIALQAQVMALQATSQSNASTNKKQSAKGKEERKTNTGKWAWKDKAPKAGESNTITFEGRKYVHCPHHASTKWVLADKHKDGCKLDPNWKFPKDDDDDEKKLTYAKALLHVVDECNDEENI